MKDLIHCTLLKVILLVFGMLISDKVYSQNNSQDSLLINSVNYSTSYKAERVSFVPAGNASTSNAITSFRLVTTTNGTLAALNLGIGFNNKFSGNIEVASPLSDNGFTRPANLDGLASDGRITFGFKYKGWKALTTEEIRNALKPYQVNSFMDLSEANKHKILENLMPNPWFIGVTGTLNKQNFAYAIDNMLVDFKDEDKYSFASSVYAGVYVGKSLNSLFRLIWLYNNSFISNKSNEYYVPYNGGPTLVKRNIVIGAPSHKQNHQIQIENVTRFLDAKLGINPSITYLSNDEDFVFDLPLYVIPQFKDEKFLDLNGGVFINYRTISNSPFSVGLFIGSSLNKILGL
ncbi:hypothetical protein [Rufibacter psychrotolerans]|uniref:hypothetical protein n=1 Tax=Rufibacter psychrotolerans TaxID=2812556 RepID=UPI0019672AFA|nr:hypothetical protein [Rufibacter sp. SYSU D00308]